MKEEFKNINNKDKNQNVYTSYKPESRIDNTKSIYEFLDEERKEFSKLFDNTIREVCIFADKYNSNINNMLVYLISELLTHCLVSGNSAYDAFYPKQENDKPLGKWIVGKRHTNTVDGPLFFVCNQCKTKSHNNTRYCPNCGAKMER